jgi:predicted CXXCH cytochrome family protein
MNRSIRIALVTLVASAAWALTKTQECLDCHAALQNPVTNSVSHAVNHGSTAFDCANCHLDHKAQSDANPSVKLSQPYLIAARQQLCQTCHNEITHKTFVHEPAKLDCTICHNPHGEAAASLRAESNALCLECHSTASKSKFEAGGPVTLFGGQVTLSVRLFGELKLVDLTNDRGHPVSNHPVRRPQDAHWPAVSCVGCHSPHGADHSSTLLVTESETFVSLCQRCHK